MSKRKKDVSINNSCKKSCSKTDNNESTKSKKLDKVINKMKDKFNPTEEQLEKIEDFASKYSDKSEEELLFEIVNLNKKILENDNNNEFKKKIRKLEKLRPMLNDQQKEKLDKVLTMLKNDE